MKYKIIILSLLIPFIFTGCSDTKERKSDITEITTSYTNDGDYISDEENSEETTDEEDNESKKLERSLKGLWTCGNQYIEFRDKNMFKAMGEERNEYSGTYSLVANQKIIAIALAVNENDVRTFIAEFKEKDDNRILVLKNENNETFEFIYSKVK